MTKHDVVEPLDIYYWFIPLTCLSVFRTFRPVSKTSPLTILKEAFTYYVVVILAGFSPFLRVCHRALHLEGLFPVILRYLPNS